MPKTYSINGIPLKSNFLKLNYNPLLRDRAKALRKARNLPEVLFWMQVHKHQFHGLDFDRQKIIGNFIVDFYIKSLALIVEIDGSSHDNREEQDAARERFLVELGCRVLRFTAGEVLEHMDQVLRNMEEYILEHYSI
tara:strand:+ start:743 stop:1153 length:411 start_codon:yes stop_codon:yes gene_type:complete